MTRKIFIWVAHPKQGSLSAALADAYEEGAKDNAAQVRRMDLADMEFDPSFSGYEPGAAPLETDLLAWQDNIAWADHILILHPYWWGAMPTLAKAVLDRALTPGFAFKYHARGVKWDRLLKGRTADAIITSDTPPWLDTLLYLKPARRVLKKQVLGFCGIKARHIRQFGSVKLATPEKITSWISKARHMGQTAAA
ncbi:MAG: NAD(P)H-dependent oxidoreductase [Pseudomonadota bacterium]